MKSKHYLAIVVTSLLLLACSPDNGAKTRLFEEQRGALEKAKEVENTVRQQTQEAQQNVEKQTQ